MGLLYPVKKGSDFPVPSRDVANQTLLWREIIKLFPAREFLVSDVSARKEKSNLSLQCMYCRERMLLGR